MTAEISIRRVNVRGIIYRDGKILAVRHKDENGGPADYYAIPGGGVDPYEPLVQAMERELMEETSVKANIGRILFIQQYRTVRKGFDEELEFFFSVKNPEDFNNIKLDETSHGNDEIYDIGYVNPKEVRIFPAFLSEIDINTYIAEEQPVYIADNLSK